MTAKQQLLDIHGAPIPTLDNFVGEANQEILAALAGVCTSDEPTFTYLWGPSGCGRSHLLAATAQEASQFHPVLHLQGQDVNNDIPWRPGQLLIIDDIMELSPDGQTGLFRAYNTARTEGLLSLLLSGPSQPLALPIREDLRTRLGQCTIYEIKPLSDAEKAAALQLHAEGLSMRLDESLIHYLLRHGKRDLPSLLAAVDALDHASLEQKRPATLPLLKDVLAGTPP